MIQRVKAFFLGKPGDWTSMTRTQEKAEGESQLHKVILWLPTLQCALSCAMPHPKDNYNHKHNWFLKTVKRCIDMFPAIKAEEIGPGGTTNLYLSCCFSRMMCSWEEDAHFSKSVWKGTADSRSVSWGLKCACGKSKFSGHWMLHEKIQIQWSLKAWSFPFVLYLSQVMLMSFISFNSYLYLWLLFFSFADSLDLQHQLFFFPSAGNRTQGLCILH